MSWKVSNELQFHQHKSREEFTTPIGLQIERKVVTDETSQQKLWETMAHQHE